MKCFAFFVFFICFVVVVVVVSRSLALSFVVKLNVLARLVQSLSF